MKLLLLFALSSVSMSQLRIGQRWALVAVVTCVGAATAFMG